MPDLRPARLRVQRARRAGRRRRGCERLLRVAVRPAPRARRGSPGAPPQARRRPPRDRSDRPARRLSRRSAQHHAAGAGGRRPGPRGDARPAARREHPKGIRPGQQLRLAGQGGPGEGDGSLAGAAGDLYLEIAFAPNDRFRIDGRDVSFDLPVSPWEAALGARITVTTPDGPVDMAVPAGSRGGRRLRLKGRGLPSNPPGDLYAVLALALPPAVGEAAQAAYAPWQTPSPSSIRGVNTRRDRLQW